MRFKARLADPHIERALFQRRVWFAFATIIVFTVSLLAQLFNLQIIRHAHYSTLSDGNRMRIEPVAPTRGLILDRNGEVLADNRPSFTLELVPEQVADIEAALSALGDIIEIRPQDLDRFRAQIRRQRRFEAVPVRFQLNDDEVAAFAVNRHRFPGVDVRATLARRYPYGATAAHVTGYVGAISEADLAGVEAAAYSGTTHFGKTGIELTFEGELLGQVGYRQIETNAQGRLLRVVDYTPPQPGADITLTLDIRLQRAAEEALGDYAGSIVAIDPRNGEVLALVSRPGFDPNLFVDGIDPAAFRALERDTRRPLFNRALRGRYPPGSTVKSFLGLAALLDGTPLAEQSLWCQGWFQLPGGERRYRDWERDGHGRVDLHRSVVESCDVYFYQLALELGVDRMHRYLTAAGFGVPTGIDMVGELVGLVPSREWKRATMNQSWFPGETVIFGIGQGYMLSTPLQLAHSSALTANRGIAWRPHLRRSLTRSDGTTEAVEPQQSTTLAPERRTEWDAIVSSLVDVVHAPRGSARAVAPRGWRMAGKTGTAQVYSLSQDDDERIDPLTIAEHLRDHALFIGFAPVDEPTLAIAVVVEHGGSGGRVAAPVARQVMDAWMAIQEAP